MKPAPKVRKDGWTAERQLRFLETLARTRNTRAAARAAGMSREGAYRFRNRQPDGLFAALWDLALAPPPAAEVHTRPLTDGWLMRLLGNHYRRESARFDGSSGHGASVAAPHRQQPW